MTIHRLGSYACLLMLLSGLPGVVSAQSPADAARAADPNLQRERTERNREFYDERERPQRAPSDEPVITTPSGAGKGKLPDKQVKFTLERIEFDESAFIEADRLDAIASDYIGQPVTFADLNEMVGRVNAIYAERGIVNARALIPPQTIQSGVLRVRLVEGRLDELDVQGNQAVRASFVENRLPLEAGKVVDTPALREQLNWLNRTTELRLSAALRAGEGTGETNVNVAVEEPPRYTAQVFTDNAGSESTGEFRGGAILQMYAPLGVDDRLTVYGVGSEGATNASIGYQFPFNRDGGRIGLNYATGDIEIIDGPFEPLDITGESTNYSVRATQPFVRDDDGWLDVYAGASRIESSTDIGGVALSEFDVDRYSVGLDLRGYGRGQAWRLSQGVASADSEDIFGETTSLTLFTGSGYYIRSLGERWTLQLRGAWQYTSEETAPSPLVFQVGGASSVRGYDESILGGARGYYLNLEGRYRWRYGLVPFVFLDHGLVDDISPDRETATSVGAGLAWRYGDHIDAEVAWGQTLEDVVPEQDSGRLHLRLALRWP